MDVMARNKLDETPCMIAALEGKYNILEYFSEQPNFDWFQTDFYGDSLLHFAVKGRSYKTVEFLVMNSNKILGIKNRDGTVAFQYAIDEGVINIVKLLENY